MPSDRFNKAYENLLNAKAEMRTVMKEAYGPEVKEDYEFQTEQGQVKLSELFGDHDDLLVIHNMGRSCNYCTLWADGLASLEPMIAERCALALSSPDAPETQAEVKAKRGWPYRMVSVKGNRFAHDMGYVSDHGYMPGVSAFHKSDTGEITRTGSSFFGPGDDFCAVWPLFELLEGGANGWEPK